TSTSTSAINAWAFGASASGALGLLSATLSGAGAGARNHIRNRVESYIQDTPGSGRTVQSGQGSIVLSATDNSTIDSIAVGATVNFSAGAGSISGSAAAVAAVNLVSNEALAYVEGASVSSMGGAPSVQLTSASNARIHSTSIAASISVAASVG